MEDPISSLFQEMKISDTSTRSSASRSKKSAAAEEQSIHACIICLQRMRSKKDLSKHLQVKHRADKEVIKQEFRDAKAELATDPDEVSKYNYQLALAKVTLLEKL
jgi:hypothetical protein